MLFIIAACSILISALAFSQEKKQECSFHGISYQQPAGIQEAGQGGEIRLQRLRSRSGEREEPLCARKAVIN